MDDILEGVVKSLVNLGYTKQELIEGKFSMDQIEYLLPNDSISKYDVMAAAVFVKL